MVVLDVKVPGKSLSCSSFSPRLAIHESLVQLDPAKPPIKVSFHWFIRDNDSLFYPGILSNLESLNTTIYPGDSWIASRGLKLEQDKDFPGTLTSSTTISRQDRKEYIASLVSNTDTVRYIVCSYLAWQELRGILGDTEVFGSAPATNVDTMDHVTISLHNWTSELLTLGENRKQEYKCNAMGAIPLNVRGCTAIFSPQKQFTIVEHSDDKIHFIIAAKDESHLNTKIPKPGEVATMTHIDCVIRDRLQQNLISNWEHLIFIALGCTATNPLVAVLANINELQ